MKHSVVVNSCQLAHRFSQTCIHSLSGSNGPFICIVVVYFIDRLARWWEVRVGVFNVSTLEKLDITRNV